MRNFYERPDKNIHLLDLIIIWIVCVSLGAVGLLCLHHFRPIYALLAGSVCCGLIFTLLRPKIQVRMSQRFVWFGLILLLALSFRFQPYLWIMGIQDPGIYVNMASYYERYGTPFIVDTVREKLTDGEKRYYDDLIMDDLYKEYPEEKGRQFSQYPIASPETLKKLNLSQLIGYLSVMPGVYFKDLSKSEYVFQFYPLHPLWMAIFSYLFGETNGIYSLTFFSLMTIVVFYRLAKVVSGDNEKAGLIASGLLAINPLHVFFSKFPVTEVCFLFFTVSGLYYLAAYVRALEDGEQCTSWHLIMSWLLFLCAFLTRYTGFLYLPFFYLMITALFIVRDKVWLDKQKTLLQYGVAIICAYILSVCYGLTYSLPYTMEGFGLTFGKAVVNHWQLSLVTAFFVLVILPFIAKEGLSQYVDNLQGWISNNIRFIVVTCMFIVMAVAAVFAFMLYLMKGKDAFMTSTAVIAVSQMTPFAFMLLIIAFESLRRDKNSSISQIWLALFITIFWGVYTLAIRTLPYQYYYARYLLSEVVPYSLLFVAIYLGKMLQLPAKRNLAILVVGAVSIYSLYFSACQFKGREADGAYDALKKVSERVQRNDILFVTFNDFKLLTPLKLFFDLSTFRIEDAAAIKENANGLLSTMGQAYILAKSPVEARGTTLLKVIDYRQGEFEHAKHIPTSFAYIDSSKLYLYRIDKQVF